MKKISVLVCVIILVAAVVGFTVSRQSSGVDTSVFSMTKAEYGDLATANCTKSGHPESFCRCFYAGLLKTNSVQQTFEYDAAVAANPEAYEFTTEQYSLISECAKEVKWES
jgi:hypothetical protein